MTHSTFLAPVLAAVLVAVSSGATAQTAAPDARARYEQEREKCKTNNSQESAATCLREANNALEASRKGQLSNPGPAVANDNATQRCSAFPTAAEQAECERRVQTPVSGSVSGGGVLRESVTTTVVPAPAQRP